MKEFALLFRQPDYNYSEMSPKDMEALTLKWKAWTGNITDQGRMTGGAIRLALEGKVLKSGGLITDGPFVEIREMLGSLIVIKATDLEEATTFAHGCPALDFGGSVEIRPIFQY